MKTKGQRLYEHKNPEFIEVVLRSDVFGEYPFYAQNPADSQRSWERLAEGHYIFSEEEDS